MEKFLKAGVACTTPTPAPTPTAAATPTASPTPSPVDKALKSLVFIGEQNKSSRDFIEQQAWYHDGLSPEESAFLNDFAANPLSWGSSYNQTPKESLEKMLANPMNHFVSGSTSTMQGELEVAIFFQPEKTGREHAEKVRDLYRALIPLFEEYMGLPNKEMVRSGVYSVFINGDDGHLPSPQVIPTRANNSLDTLAHEGVHTSAFLGPNWLDEGFADFLAAKGVGWLGDKDPDFTKKWYNAAGVEPKTSKNSVKIAYESALVFLERERYVKGEGLVGWVLPNGKWTPWKESYSTPPPNGKSPLEIKLIEFGNYNVINGSPTTYGWGLIFLAKLEVAIGEDALRGSIREVAKSNFRRETSPEQVYKTMRSAVPADKIAAFDAHWEEYGFGVGNLPNVTP
ncbi:hypothetical protein HYU17_04045 [Candidatus Woesearchaeota archaeon]|nr:hypothetical protein [Candidatus Woesearchaeota archaeon]